MTDLRVIGLILFTLAGASLVSICVWIGLNCIAERSLSPEGDDE